RLTSVRLIARKVGASMKTARAILVVGVLLFVAADLIASGPVGIYAIIEKVIFEPSEQAPERIQIWGAFAVVDGGLTQPGATSKPLRGYLYFKLPDGSAQAAAKTEWTDLKTVAGTGQAIGFGNWGYVGRVQDFGSRPNSSSGIPYFLELYPGGGRQTDVRVRRDYDASASPAVYSTNAGIVKLADQGSHAEIVKQLREALKAR
ncbi:MAG: hypothetical protein DMG17_10110, partial [Acidobacteria bacterium]